MKCQFIFFSLVWASYVLGVVGLQDPEPSSTNSSNLSSNTSAAAEAVRPQTDLLSDAIWLTDRAINKTLPMIPPMFRREVFYYGRSVWAFFELLVLPVIIAKAGDLVLRNTAIVIRVLTLHVLPIYMFICAAQEDGNHGFWGLLWSRFLLIYSATYGVLLAAHVYVLKWRPGWVVDRYCIGHRGPPFAEELDICWLLYYLFMPVGALMACLRDYSKEESYARKVWDRSTTVVFVAEWAMSNISLLQWAPAREVPVTPAGTMATFALAGTFFYGWTVVIFKLVPDLVDRHCRRYSTVPSSPRRQGEGGNEETEECLE